MGILEGSIVENWGRWGSRDEAGALNHIGEAAIRGAAGLVRQGKVISLAQVISASMPVPKSRAGFQHFMGRDGGDYAAGRPARGGFQYADDTVLLPLHSGTHLDALCHCWYGDKLYNGYAATEVNSSGARRLGIDKTAAVATRGVLLDFVALAGAPLEDGFSIGADMLRAAIARTGGALQPGDAVLLRTGWQELRDAGAPIDFNAEPGIDLDAAMVLAEVGVAMIGADNYSIEVLPFPEGTVFPVHQRLIRDFGIPLLEGLVLDELAREATSFFLFVCAPLKIRGATGSPVNPIVVL
ncbi:cyclase family protein [Mesorhizobium sp. ANAO-SY3R2]|uniref:cyclase family protein n=1 Tax=Mesorhizobium sp. ANAO-SY3R2 TaxID=3166644 RepID=UPI00367318CA